MMGRCPMLRGKIPLLLGVLGMEPASATDGPVATKRAAYRAASKLPPGLPRTHYKYRTTVAPAAPPYGRRVYVEEEPEVLFTPSSGYVPYVPPLVGTPLLPGSSALPCDYWRAFR